MAGPQQWAGGTIGGEKAFGKPGRAASLSGAQQKAAARNIRTPVEGVFAIPRTAPARSGHPKRMGHGRVEYIGGPLDGKIVELGPDEDITTGAYLTIPGHPQRAVYEPVPGDIVSRWHFLGWIDR